MRQGGSTWESGSRTAARRLGGAIIRGDYPEQARLPLEAALAEELSVSRNTLREAMRLLVAKGLVEIRPRLGTVVLPRASWNFLDTDMLDWWGDSFLEDPGFMIEILRMREMVEPFAAAEAAGSATPAQVTQIREALDWMRREMTGGGLGASVEADLAFHRAIIEAAGNRFITSIGKALTHALRMHFRALIATPDNFRLNIPNHENVLDAIAAHDIEGARAAMAKLVSQAGDDTRRLIANKGADRPKASQEEK